MDFNYKNLFLICIVLLVLLYLFIKNKMYTNKSNYLFVLISVIAALYTFIRMQNNMIEKYDDTNIPVAATATTTKIDSNEDIKKIQDKLTVYLTTYSDKSYNEGYVWRNISQFATSKNKQFIFDHEPSFTASKELKVQSNKITGPFTMDLGINMNNDFTIFINAKIAVNKSLNIFRIFELYATDNNTGVYLHIVKDTNGIYFLKLRSAFTSPVFFEISNSKNVTIFDNNYHLFTVTKSNDFLKLYVDNNIDPIITAEIVQFENKFSNRSIVLLDNKENNVPAYISHFGIYDKELSIIKGVRELSVLYDYIQEIILKQSNTYNELLDDYNKLKDSINLTKANPFNNDKIKDKCHMITNWNSFEEIISKADDECLKSINEYCQTDKNFEQCKVWNSFQKLVPYFTQQENQKNLSKELLDVNIVADAPINDNKVVPVKPENKVTSTEQSINPVTLNGKHTIPTDALLKKFDQSNIKPVKVNILNSENNESKYNTILNLFNKEKKV